MQGMQVKASCRLPVGARNAARSGSNSTIFESMRGIVQTLMQHSLDSGELCTPGFMVAAGMITSSLGLKEIQHIPAPAGLDQLQVAAQWHSSPEISSMPILLVPGVRCGPERPSLASVDELDLMRGEETLCAGLIANRVIAGPAVVMNLGSHWKAIQLDEKGRIAASVTSLSGELIHATQQNTILAGSVAQDWPTHFSEPWIQAGMSEQRRSGLARSAFCARLLDLQRQATPEDRLAFLVGAFIASDLDPLLAQKFFQRGSRIALVGSSAVANAWHYALSTAQLASIIISQKQTEEALLTALRLILKYCISSSSSHSRRTYSS